MRNRLRFLVDWSDRFHWLWLGLAAPFLLFPTPKKTLVLLVVPGTWLLHWLANRRQLPGTKDQPPVIHQYSPIPITPFNGAIFLVALMVLVSLWATYDVHLSLPKVSGMVLGVGVFFAIAREGHRPAGWWWSCLLFLGAGLGVAVLGLFGTQWAQYKLRFLNPIFELIPTVISGLQGAEVGFHPNEVAGALTWVLPLFFTLSGFFIFSKGILEDRANHHPVAFIQKAMANLHNWQRWGLRAIFWLVTLFVAGVFVLTQSRSAYLGLSITILVLLLLVLRARGRWVFVGLLLIGGLLLGFFLWKNGGYRIQSWVLVPIFSYNSLHDRQEIWLRAIYLLQDFPFTGMGMNTFREAVYMLYPISSSIPDANLGHAHNEFLQAGLDLGMPGMIAFIALHMIAFWMLANAWRNARFLQLEIRRMQYVIIMGLGGGLLAHMLYGLVDAVALGAKPGILFWMLLGLIAGLDHPSGLSHTDPADGRSPETAH